MGYLKGSWGCWNSHIPLTELKHGCAYPTYKSISHRPRPSRTLHAHFGLLGRTGLVLHALVDAAKLAHALASSLKRRPKPATCLQATAVLRGGMSSLPPIHSSGATDSSIACTGHGPLLLGHWDNVMELRKAVIARESMP